MGKPITGLMQETALRCGTSKASGHSYMPIYEELFDRIRWQPIRLLELGIDRGASLALWLEWFPKAEIYAVDAELHPSSYYIYCNANHPRLHLFQCDVSDPQLATLFRKDLFDVIIDDACHIPHVQRASQHYLWDSLKPGGMYFVEDVNLSPTMAEQGWELNGEDILYPWSLLPGFRVWANFMDGQGNYRDDDVLIMVRKPE